MNIHERDFHFGIVNIVFILLKNNKKAEFTTRLSHSKTGISDITNAIDMMRQSRDIKIADIEKYNEQILVSAQIISHCYE